MASAPKTASTKSKISSKTNSDLIMEAGKPAYDVEERLEYIATAAYFKAAARGFEAGDEVQDWLAAEAEFEEREGD